MAVPAGASPREGCAHDESLREGAEGWCNLRPLDAGCGGAVGRWLDLLASISHELRTPLNAVIGFSDAMQQEVFGPIGNERYQEYVRHIRASGVDLLVAAEDALATTAALARPKATVLDDVTLAQVVSEALEGLAVRPAGRAITIEVDIAGDLDVRGDQRILARAIRQLAGLAISRAVPGSAIRISALAAHGLVELRLDVPQIVAGAPVLIDDRLAADMDRGLGRRELAVWLATALLDLMDCRLTTVMHGGVLSLRTTLEQCIQGSLFTRPVGVSA